MLFFVNKGFRVVAHDRRGHGRSDQVWDGHDMDHYADDVAAVVKHRPAYRVRCMSGIQPAAVRVVRYIARHGEDKVSKAVLINCCTAPDGEDGRVILRVRQSQCLMIFRPSWRRIVLSFITTCPRDRSMDLIARGEAFRSGHL